MTIHISRMLGNLCAIGVFACANASAVISQSTTGTWPAFGGVATQNPSYPLCSGTVISPTWVLTAAHCGASTSSTFSQTFQGFAPEGGYSISEVITDPNYNGTSTHDVALLHLTQPFFASVPFILSVDPPPNSEPSVAPPVYVEGYGQNSGVSGSEPEGLSSIGTFLIRAAAEPIAMVTLTSDQTWLGLATPSQHICPGDEGGPSFVYGNNGFPIVYATTQGTPTKLPCLLPDVGSIGIRIDQVLPFIEQHVTDICLSNAPAGPHCDGIFRDGNEYNNPQY